MHWAGGWHCNEMLQKVIPSPVKHWAAVPAVAADDGSISAIASHIDAYHSFICQHKKYIEDLIVCQKITLAFVYIKLWCCSHSPWPKHHEPKWFNNWQQQLDVVTLSNICITYFSSNCCCCVIQARLFDCSEAAQVPATDCSRLWALVSGHLIC